MRTQKEGLPVQHRHGFTVVELLVVIAILGVLAALITPAIFGAITKAKQARIKMEIGNIAMALERYSTERGELPPDFSITANTTAELRAAKQNAITDHLSRSFRYRLARQVAQGQSVSLANIQSNSTDMLTDAELDALNPKTALTFWLRGISPEPTQPLRGAGDRDRFYDFEESRLRLIENSDPEYVFPMYEYVPPGDSTNSGYVYYRANFAGPVCQQLAAAAIETSYRSYCDATIWAKKQQDFGADVPAPYLRALDPVGLPWPNKVDNPGRIGQLFQYAEPEKFQIISAGLDGFYGVGGIDGFDEKNGRLHLYPAGPYTKVERDNITNFAEQTTLEESTP